MDQQIEDIPDIETLLSDKEVFNNFVYTPFSEALAELSKRRKDHHLGKRVNDLLSGDIPEPFLEQPRIALIRYLITPNYESLRFLHIASEVEGLDPLLCEYTQDKFVPSNVAKRLLGKLTFFIKWDHNGNLRAERLKIIDFDASMNRSIADIKTTWGQALSDFHRSFFNRIYPHFKISNTYDISKWYISHGPQADKFYPSLLALFIRHGILFEHFLVHEKEESAFIKNVFLPSFIQVFKLTGHKPLIVAFEPTDVEGDKYWLCYPPEGKKFVEDMLAS